MKKITLSCTKIKICVARAHSYALRTYLLFFLRWTAIINIRRERERRGYFKSDDHKGPNEVLTSLKNRTGLANNSS